MQLQWECDDADDDDTSSSSFHYIKQQLAVSANQAQTASGKQAIWWRPIKKRTWLSLEWQSAIVMEFRAWWIVLQFSTRF